jgi:hypothetical protein
MFGVKRIEVLPNGKRKAKLHWWLYVLIAIPCLAFAYWSGWPWY